VLHGLLTSLFPDHPLLEQVQIFEQVMKSDHQNSKRANSEFETDLKTGLGNAPTLSTSLIQVRAEAWLTAFFYNNTQRGFCETR
jgi:hypothetical protein